MNADDQPYNSEYQTCLIFGQLKWSCFAPEDATILLATRPYRVHVGLLLGAVVIRNPLVLEHIEADPAQQIRSAAVLARGQALPSLLVY